MIFSTKNKYMMVPKLLGKTLSLKIAALLLTAIAIFFNTSASSQNAARTVSGQVTDVSTGETLVGATVSVQGAANSVTVDRAGKFLIQVPAANSVLVITFTGYTELQVPLEGKTVLDIKL